MRKSKVGVNVILWTAAIDNRQACDGQPEALVHYVIVRADLPHGSQVAQTIHAAGESTPIRVPTNTIAVALAARDENHLRTMSDMLALADIPHVLIREPVEGRTDGEAMSIGIEPTRNRLAIRKVTSCLPCVR